MSSSRIQPLLTLVRSLPPTPLRPVGSPQLSTALENIINRSNPTEESITSITRSLERLQSGSALKEFPLSTKLTKPVYDPLLYSRILEGVHRSAKGQGRSFWRKFFQLRGDA